MSKLSPMEICILALKKKGVPDYILNDLKPGRVTDAWVQLVVMDDLPWQEVAARIEKATEVVMKKISNAETNNE